MQWYARICFAFTYIAIPADAYLLNGYVLNGYVLNGYALNGYVWSCVLNPIRKIIRIHSMHIHSIRIHSKGMHQQEWQCMWIQDIHQYVGIRIGGIRIDRIRVEWIRIEKICVEWCLLIWCDIRQQSSEEPCDETSFGKNVLLKHIWVTVGSRSTITHLGTCLPAPVSEKNLPRWHQENETLDGKTK